MRAHSAGCLALVLLLAMIAPALRAADYRSSLVTIKVTTQSYDHYSPWRKLAPSQQEIQGCLIDGGRILTVAHPLVNQVLMEVSKHGSPRKYTAELLLSDYVAGLALLTVPDPSFAADLAPLALADPGRPRGELRIARWEAGGVLREFSASLVKTAVDYFSPLGATLAHSLATDMDRGGSGEPVFVDGKLVGLAYYLEPSSKNLKVIAVEAVRRLLRDLEDGRYDGYPSSWEYARGLEGDANLKGYLGMGAEETGALVTAVPPHMSGAGVLEPNDVILEVDGRRIDDSGLYESSSYGPLHYESLLFLDHQIGETITVRVLRDRARLELSVPLLPLDDEAFLIPAAAADAAPLYIVFGGLVFQELTRDYLQSAWGSDWWRTADSRLLFYYDSLSLFPEPDRRRVVVLNRVLPHAVNAGYQSQSNLALERVDGERVRDLAHLAELLARARDGFAVFAFAGGDRIVLGREGVAGAEAEIRSGYGLPASASPGLAGEPHGS